MTSTKLTGGDDNRQASSSPPTERAIKIMELLAADRDRLLTLTEISRELDISRPTCHAILATLTDHRWAVRDARTNGYTWGPAISSLARTAGDGRFHGALSELNAATGFPAFVARREGESIAVIDSVGDGMRGPSVQRGFRIPLVAPFGRDFVAWASAADQRAWLDGICTPSSALYARLTAVLAQVRHRGVVIERLTPEYVRVYSALRAVGAESGPDPITARLAHAFADLTTVDFLPDEIESQPTLSVATVSAPVFDQGGVVRMSVTAAPFGDLTPDALATLSNRVRTAAAELGTGSA